MEKKKGIIIGAIVVVVLFVGILFLLNFDKAVYVSIDDIDTDGFCSIEEFCEYYQCDIIYDNKQKKVLAYPVYEEYNKDYVKYDMTGKKIMHCNVKIHNYSFYKFEPTGLKNDSLDLIMDSTGSDQLINLQLSMYAKGVVSCYFIVDEDDSITDIKERLSKTKITCKIFNKGDDTEGKYACLKVDNA